MKKAKIIPQILGVILITTLIASCNNRSESNKSSDVKDETSENEDPKSKEAKKAAWFDNCDGLETSRYKGSLQYGPSDVVGGATLNLLRNKVGSYSSYSFHLAGPVEIRNNCQYIVPVKATADIGAPEEELSVRVGWDGKEFYLN